MDVPNPGNGNECERTGLGSELACWRASRKKYSSRQLSQHWSPFDQKKFMLFHINGVNAASIGRRILMARLISLPVKFDISTFKLIRLLPNPQCNPARQHGLRLEYILRTTTSAAAVLFLLLVPALVGAQAAVPDKQSGPVQERRTRQSGSTEGSATQSAAGTQSKPQTAVPTPVSPVPTPTDQKTDNSEGKQTKLMFGIVPNFAAVSANTQLPPLSTRAKF